MRNRIGEHKRGRPKGLSELWRVLYAAATREQLCISALRIQSFAARQDRGSCIDVVGVGLAIWILGLARKRFTLPMRDISRMPIRAYRARRHQWD